MKPLTKQEVFDKTVEHLFNQKEKAIRGGTCVYKNSSGLKCAIGHFIPTESYSSAMEGNDVKGLYVSYKFMFNKIGITQNVIPLLDELQNTHDFHSPKGWFEELYDVARKFNLSTQCIPKENPIT